MPEILRDAVVSMLHGWWTPAPACGRWLDNPFYRSYAVLTMCRMRYTLQYGVVVSKPIAALWAQAALETRWTPLIEARARRDSSSGDPQNVPRSQAERLPSTAGRNVSV